MSHGLDRTERFGPVVQGEVAVVGCGARRGWAMVGELVQHFGNTPRGLEGQAWSRAPAISAYFMRLSEWVRILMCPRSHVCEERLNSHCEWYETLSMGGNERRYADL